MVCAGSGGNASRADIADQNVRDRFMEPPPLQRYPLQTKLFHG